MSLIQQRSFAGGIVFLEAAQTAPAKLIGIVEVDETYVLRSEKGQRGLTKKSRKRGGKASKRGLSNEQIPILMAADRSGLTYSTVLQSVTGKTLSAAREPVLEPDVLLVSDCTATTKTAPCEKTLEISREALKVLIF